MGDNPTLAANLNLLSKQVYDLRADLQTLVDAFLMLEPWLRSSSDPQVVAAYEVVDRLCPDTQKEPGE